MLKVELFVLAATEYVLSKTAEWDKTLQCRIAQRETKPHPAILCAPFVCAVKIQEWSIVHVDCLSSFEVHKRVCLLLMLLVSCPSLQEVAFCIEEVLLLPEEN